MVSLSVLRGGGILVAVLTALALAQGCGGGATPATEPQTATAAEPETAPAAGPDTSLTADPETAPPAQPDAAPSPTATSAPSPLPTPTTVRTEEVDPLYEESLLIFDYDQRSPVDVQEVSVDFRDGVSVYDIHYASPKGGRVPAFLLVPEGPGPFAGLILQHGAPGDRTALLPYGVVLAKTGVVILLIDAPFARPNEENVAMGPVTYTERDRDEQVQLIIDLRRGIDLLVDRSDVDPDRIAYIGVSYGATIGGLLSGVDRRVKAYVLAVGDGGILEHLCEIHGDATTPWGPKFVTTEIATQTFYHVALVFDQPAAKITGFLDGRSFGEVEGVGKLFTHGSDINIGRVGDTTVFHDGDTSAGHYFGGLVDEVIIYRRALLASEIRAIFIAGSNAEEGSIPLPPSQGLISWWPGEGNARDVTRTNAAVLRNGVTFASGKVGQAFSLDGKNDFVFIPGTPDINTAGPYTHRTINLWFKTSDDVTTRQVLWEEGGYLRGFSIYLENGLVYVNGWNLPNDDTPPACHLPEEQEEVWVAAMQPIEAINFVGHAAPAALFFQGANNDQLIREEDAVRYQEAGSEPKEIKWYETGHGLSPEAFHDQVVWLQRYIGLDVSKFEAAGAVRPADDMFPDWSPDGSQIVFMSNRDGMHEIYVMQPDGSNQTNLSYHPGNDRFPVWSPDGSKIAFMSTRDGFREVYVMEADGTKQTRLTIGPAFDTFPDWSPDGSKIVFSSNRTTFDNIYVMNSDGSDLINVSNSMADDFYPRWSPDGSKIVFSSNRDGYTEIYLMSADGSDQTNLTVSDTDDFFPSWSPDGTKIAFMSTRDGNSDIYVMNSDGSNPVRLTNHPGFDSFPSWSPDGTKIAFVSVRGAQAEIFVMNADGSDAVRLTNNFSFSSS